MLMSSNCAFSDFFANLRGGMDKLVCPCKVLQYTEKNRNCGKVAIVCGGGSGHEPAHSSFVNHDMLSAAICGDVFASSSVGAIVDGIRTLCSSSDNSPKAVLVIIKIIPVIKSTSVWLAQSGVTRCNVSRHGSCLIPVNHFLSSSDCH